MKAIKVVVSTVIMGLLIYAACYGMTVVHVFEVESQFVRLHRRLPMSRVVSRYTPDNPEAMAIITSEVRALGKLAIIENSRVKFLWNQLHIEIHELDRDKTEELQTLYDVRIIPLPSQPPYDIRPSLIYVEVPYRTSFGIVKRTVILKHLTWR